jgi:hypothetical protein
MLTNDDLKKLAAISGPCLTIFEPLRDEYSQVTKPVTRIVAALQEARRLLDTKGFTPAECDDLLQPLMKLAARTDWAARKGSMLMFRAPDFTMTNFWPETLAPRVHFGQEFLLLPLLPGFLSKHDFWLLGLTTKAVRLFRGTRHGLVEVPLPRGVPRNLAEAGETVAPELVTPDRTLNGRSSAGRSVGNRKGVQFGMSAAHEVKAAYLHDFFKDIDRGIRSVLAHDPQPLILAGVTREIAIYRDINTYSPVLTGAIHGSPFTPGPEALYRKALDLMSAYSAMAMDGAPRKLDDAASRGLLATDPVQLIRAANAGQIDELILSPNAPGFGQREELINWAALAAIRTSGTIGFLEQGGSDSGITGILRFRAPDTAAVANEA